MANDRISLLLTESGEFLSEFLSYKINKSYLEQTAGFEFNVHTRDLKAIGQEAFNLLCGQGVVISLNGRNVLTGKIYEADPNEEGVVVLKGFDHLAALRGGLNRSIKLDQEMPLKQAILKCVLPFGFAQVRSGNDAWRDLQLGGVGLGSFKPEKDKDDPDKVKISFKNTHNETTTWNFVNKLAADYGFTIQATNDPGALSLCKPEFRQKAAYKTLWRTDAQDSRNNLLRGKATRNYSDMPTVIQIDGKGGSASEKFSGLKTRFSIADFLNEGKNHEISFTLGPRVIQDSSKAVFLPKTPSDLPDQSLQGLISKDGTNLIYNPLFISDSHCTSKEEIQNRVKREFSERLKQTLTYTCTVPGHIDPETDHAWTVDTVVAVSDVVMQVHEELWIESRSFEGGGTAAPTTTMTLIPKGGLIF